MKKFLSSLVALLAVVFIALATLYVMGTRDDSSVGADRLAGDGMPLGAAATQPDKAAMIDQGRYLATVGNCIGCHTVQGGKPYAGGTPIPTPFGTLYGPNITPDAQAGIGQWSADDFWQALHNGKGRDGTLLYPAFPYTEYTKVSRADADALYAFLMAQPASDTPSRAHELKFPYNQRPLLAFWRALYFTPGVQTNDAGQDAMWNRGRYLVDGLAHCAACHTVRNSLGATVAAQNLGGGMIDSLGWWAPALTNHRDVGLGRWSETDIFDLLKTGVSAQGTASGPMGEIVTHSLQYLQDDDARAMARYLKTLPDTPAVDAGDGAAPDGATMQIGAKLYTQYCAQCHQSKGEGAPPAWPALAGNISVTAPSPRNAILMVLEGGFAPATAANPQPHGMPPFSQVLNDNDVAALVSYIRNSWGNNAGNVTPLSVKRARDG